MYRLLAKCSSMSEFYRVDKLICSPTGFAFHTYGRENLPVSIAILFLRAPAVDGLLGGDFLEQFKMILDHSSPQIWLESPQTEQS
jgi:hypothetical protein